MSFIMRFILVLLIVVTSVYSSFGQNRMDQTVAALEDTTASAVPMMVDSIVELKPLFMTPKKTGLFSAIIPGLGQYHNKQYWKIPIIYVGIGAAAYIISDNLKNYNAFRKEYAGRLSQDPNFVSKFPEYRDEITIKSAQDFYRRNLDLSVLITGLGYTLQVIDAVVFAHLKGFDISEDISLNYKPVMTPQGGLGFGLVMNFK